LVITLLSFATVPLRPSASEAMHAFVVQMEDGDELGLPAESADGELLPDDPPPDRALMMIPATTRELVMSGLPTMLNRSIAEYGGGGIGQGW